MKILGDIGSIVFQNKILLLLDGRWPQFFNQKNPKFEAIIDKNGRLVLRGPTINQSTQRLSRCETGETE